MCIVLQNLFISIKITQQSQVVGQSCKHLHVNDIDIVILIILLECPYNYCAKMGKKILETM